MLILRRLDYIQYFLLGPCLDTPIIIETAGLLPDLPRIRFVMLRLDYESDLLPAQLGDSAAGPVHQPMQGGLPSDDEEVLLPWEIIARNHNQL